MTSQTRSQLNLALSTALVASLAGSAGAQYALNAGSGGQALSNGNALSGNGTRGYGNALDANTRVGSDSQNGRGRNIAAENAFRNAIVTGNVGAGLAFRGNPGYFAVNDFNGNTATTTTYEFVRDTSYSGLATRGIRGFTSVQNQFDYVTGRTFADTPSNDLIIKRGMGTAGRDPYYQFAGALRSPSFSTVRETSQPNIIADSTPASGNVPNEIAPRSYVIASQLQGVRRLNDTNTAFGYRPEEIKGYQTPEQRAESDLQKTLNSGEVNTQAPTNFVSPFEAYKQQLELNNGRIDSSVTGANLPNLTPEKPKPGEPSTPGTETPGAPGKTGAPGTTEGAKPGTAPEGASPYDKRMNDLRKSLWEQPGAEKNAKPKLPSDVNGVLSEADKALQKANDTKKAIDSKDTAQTKDTKANEQIPGYTSRPGPTEVLSRTAQEAKELLSKPVYVDSLLPKKIDNQALADHIRRGQDQLAAGQFFNAEEQFASAMAMAPGDPLAAAGRVNSQIAAGMYVSAAYNLRNLLRGYPEMIAAKFDAKLLPASSRLELIRTQLRQRSEKNSTLSRDAGLLLAYLGHQTGNMQDVQDGFGIIDRVNESTNAEPDALTAALRGAWTK